MNLNDFLHKFNEIILQGKNQRCNIYFNVFKNNNNKYRYYLLISNI